jgi:uncharacterized membrane protein
MEPAGDGATNLSLSSFRIPRFDYDLDRIRGFSDCVFAVAITLVVATFKLPAAEETNQQLRAFLGDRWPAYAAYLAGFLVVGYYWLSHHRLFELIVRANGRLLWANFGLLFFVVLLPFTTEVLGNFRYLPDAYRFLDLLAMALGLVNLGMWWYATASNRLVAPDLNPAALRIYRLRAAWLPLVFFISFLITLPATPYESGQGSNLIRLAALAWGLLFVGRPLIHLVLGPVPEVEVDEEAGEVDDEATAELDALREPAVRAPTMLERAFRSTASMGRLISFSDNVYAFAITLLGTHFVAPTRDLVDRIGLDHALRDLINPDFEAYLLGFYVIALFWVLHHRMFSSIDRQDGTLRVLNLGHLMLLAVIPFTTELLSTFDDDQLPFVVYSISAGLVAMSLAIIFSYATSGRRLVSNDLDDGELRLRRWALWGNTACFAASIGLSLVSIGSFHGWTVAWILWVLPVAAYTLLNRPDPAPSA